MSAETEPAALAALQALMNLVGVVAETWEASGLPRDRIQALLQLFQDANEATLEDEGCARFLRHTTEGMMALYGTRTPTSE